MLKKVDEGTWLLLDENGTVLDEPADSCPCKGFSQDSLFAEAGMDYYEFPFDEVEDADPALDKAASNNGAGDEVDDEALDAAVTEAEAAASAAAATAAAAAAAAGKTDDTTRAPGGDGGKGDGKVVNLDSLRVRRISTGG